MPKLSQITGGAPGRMKLSQVSQRASFSDVSAGVDSTEFVERDGQFPNGERVPTLAEINAQNRRDAANPAMQAQHQAANLASRQESFRAESPLLKGIVGAGSRIPTAAMGVGQILGITDEQDAARQREEMRFMEDDAAASVGKFVGDAALLYAPGGAISKAPTVAGRLAAGAGLGALEGAARPVVDGESRAVNSAIGAGFGAGGQAVGEGLRIAGRAITPQAKTMLEAAQKRGIKLTPYQLSDSPFMKRVGKLSESLPLTGTREAARTQADDFTRAVSKTIGQDSPEITPDVFFEASNKIGDVFEGLAERNQLALSDDALNSIAAVQKEATELGDDGTIRAVNAIVDRVLSQSKVGVLSGQAYQSIDSQLGKAMAAGGEKSHYLGELRESLRNAMDQSISPADKDAWMLARQQWRDLKAIEPLVAKSEAGTISPASLLNRVTADKVGKGQMAKGTRGELGDLARLGQRMKSPRSSETTEGALTVGVFNPLNWGKAAVGIPAGRALNSQWLARLMASESRPRVANSLSQLAAPSSAASAPVLTSSLYSLLSEDPAGARQQ